VVKDSSAQNLTYKSCGKEGNTDVGRDTLEISHWLLAERTRRRLPECMDRIFLRYSLLIRPSWIRQ